MSTLSANDLVKMQDEAALRVSEMKRKSAAAVNIMNNDMPGRNNHPFSAAAQEKDAFSPPAEKHNRYHISMPVEFPEKEKPQPGKIPDAVPPQSVGISVEQALKKLPINETENKTAQKQNNAFSSALKNIFGDLSAVDSEKLFILSLCFLLYVDGGDEGLIMSLMYLIT